MPALTPAKRSWKHLAVTNGQLKSLTMLNILCLLLLTKEEKTKNARVTGKGAGRRMRNVIINSELP